MPNTYEWNSRNQAEGNAFLKDLPNDFAKIVFLDPQYRGVLDYLNYGNEGEGREAERCALPQMVDEIPEFIREIHRVLLPSGHLFLWMDKFHLVSGSFHEWLTDTGFFIVDMMVWNKGKMGMGYRTRRCSEFLVILQKAPKRAKDVWKVHDIRDIWIEGITRSKKNRAHPHQKPLNLHIRLIEAVSEEGDIVVDPAAGSFMVLEACRATNRMFLGCDING